MSPCTASLVPSSACNHVLVSQSFEVAEFHGSMASIDHSSQKPTADRLLVCSDASQWYVPTLRTWSNSTFTSALSDSRSAEEKNALADELFKRCTEGCKLGCILSV
eukprot:1159699-Pelagomonas_calceolata.AAC.5